MPDPLPSYRACTAIVRSYWYGLIDPASCEYGSPGSRLIRGSFWTLIGYSVYNVSLLVIGIIAARMLGSTGFGEIGIVQSTIGVLGLIAGLGLGITATKYVAEFRDRDPERVKNILALTTVMSLVSGTAITIVLLAAAPFLAADLFRQPGLTPVLWISTGLILASAVNGAQTGALSGFEAFRKIAVINTVTGLALIPLSFAGIARFGVAGFFGAMVAGTCIAILLNHLALRGEYRLRQLSWSLAGWRKELPVLRHFSLPAIGAALVASIAAWIVSTMLVMQPGGYGELGIFNAANQWRTILLFLPGIIALVSTPILATKFGAEGYGSSVKMLKSVILVSLLILLPTTILVCLASPFIMAQYGAGFAGSAEVLVVVAFSALFMGLSVPVGNVLAASSRMWAWFAMNLAWAAVLVGSAWALLPWGALGLGAAYAISYLLHMTWTVWYAMRGIRMEGT